MTIVSFSEVYSFQTCPRQYYYHHTLGLEPVDQKESIRKGTTGHALMEQFYKGLQAGLSKEEAKLSLRQFDQGNPTDTLKVWPVLMNYIDNLEIKGYDLFVEQVFKHEIAPDFGLTIAFRPDLAWQNSRNFWIVEDYKFVSRKWMDSTLSRYCQIKLYIALMRRMGYEVPRGFLRFFNLETGKPFYKRYEPSQVELDNLLHEFLIAALAVQDFKTRPVAEQNDIAIRTVNYTICRWCSFVLPCTLELEGKDASKTLRTQYTQSDYGYEE